MFPRYPKQEHFKKLESEIEKIFYEELSKVISDKILLEPQVNFNTICGIFRVDFYLEIDNKKVVIECDGEEFHDEGRDHYRDSILIGGNHIDELFRIRGKDIVYHVHETIYLISLKHPLLVSERGQVNLENRIDNEVIDIAKDNRFSSDYIRTGVPKPNGEGWYGIQILWNRKEPIRTEFYDFAKSKGNVGLDKTIELWRDERKRNYYF